MGDKKVIAPLHVGFAYTQPLAVVGNILDKEHGYLTMLSTVTRRPIDIVELSCHGARDAMFTMDDSKIFSTCQQDPRGVSIVDVQSRKEIKMVPVKGSRAGAMTPDGKYFLAAGSGGGGGLRHLHHGVGEDDRGPGAAAATSPVCPTRRSATPGGARPRRSRCSTWPT